jgi:hypothetical protein
MAANGWAGGHRAKLVDWTPIIKGHYRSLAGRLSANGRNAGADGGIFELLAHNAENDGVAFKLLGEEKAGRFDRAGGFDQGAANVASYIVGYLVGVHYGNSPGFFVTP